MITIPIPIPVPTIEYSDNLVVIHRERTEFAKRDRELGQCLTFDDSRPITICTGCKELFVGLSANLEPPTGFNCGGYFCNKCLKQGELADSLHLIIDVILCEIRSKNVS